MSIWVLLRGLAREAGHWGEFPDLLRARLDGTTVVTLDLPGSGARHTEHSPADIEAIVEACRTALHDAGVRPPIGLLALSLGGMVAVAWASRHPDEVMAAVLVNSSIGSFGAWHERSRPRSALALLAALISGNGERIERTVLRVTTRHPHEAAEVLLARWMRLRRRHPVTLATVFRQLWAAARYRGPAEAPGLPLLVLASADDALVHPACSTRMAEAWQADLWVHPTAGHDLPLDAPDWLADAFVGWLERARDASGTPHRVSTRER